MRPDQEPLLVEAIHAAAFKGNTLGLPKICPEENIDSISRQTLMSYLRSYHTPDRMVVAGVGVDHDELVEFTQKHFVNEKPIWGTDTSKVHVDKSVAQYTGGLVTIDKDLSNASLGPTPMPELAHLVIGKYMDEVMILISFLKTFFYVQVLNQHHIKIQTLFRFAF